jgi:hypothetical protein
MNDLVELMSNIDLSQKINIGDVLYIYKYDNYFYVIDINDYCDNVEYKTMLLNSLINPLVIAKSDITEFRKISFTNDGINEVISRIDSEISNIDILLIDSWDTIFNI